MSSSRDGFSERGGWFRSKRKAITWRFEVQPKWKTWCSILGGLPRFDRDGNRAGGRGTGLALIAFRKLGRT
jgi:hypothetical protein